MDIIKRNKRREYSVKRREESIETGLLKPALRSPLNAQRETRNAQLETPCAQRSASTSRTRLRFSLRLRGNQLEQ